VVGARGEPGAGVEGEQEAEAEAEAEAGGVPLTTMFFQEISFFTVKHTHTGGGGATSKALIPGH